jgi:ribonuclease III
MSKLISKSNLCKLENTIKIKFKDKLLLQTSVTHKSFANENRNLNIKNNERLEFLGDSVLSLTISSFIFQHFPEDDEGILAKIRSVVVSTPVLAEKSRTLNLGDYLLLGKGEELTGGRERESILADTMEAIIGAIYLDRGFKIASKFIINLFVKDIDAVKKGKHIKDYKTILQEIIQQNSNEYPIYSIIDEEGPDHNKTFLVEVEYMNKVLGSGRGSSKKEAEQKAARVALNNLNNLK